MTHLKACLLSACIALIAVTAHAQDKIYKKDSTLIEAKVKSVGEKAVTYKRFDNQDGPEYTILKNDIARIVYQNGMTDVFGDNAMNPGHRKGPKYNGEHAAFINKYGKNILSFTPGAYASALNGTINDVGLGLTYERLLDDRGRIGFNLPLMMFFSSTKDFNNNLFYYNGNNYNYTQSYTSIYFMPGIKFYPAPDREAVRYSLGAALFCIIGGEPEGVYENNGYSTTTDPFATHRYVMYGFMFSNSVNISATKHFYMAFDLNAGIPFFDNRHANNSDGLDLLIAPFMQIGFKVGYRY